jgi:uncharacterized RDD family membrane protein YckC
VQGHPAGSVSRLLAAIIDLAITVGAMLLFYLGIGAVAFVFRPRAFRWPDPGAITLGGAWWLLLVLYLTFSWTASGRTIGAQVMGLRVTDRSGRRLHGPRAFLRAVICAAFPFGLVWCAIDRRSRAVHDLIVGSQVTYDWIPTSA